MKNSIPQDLVTIFDKLVNYYPKSIKRYHIQLFFDVFFFFRKQRIRRIYQNIQRELMSIKDAVKDEEELKNHPRFNYLLGQQDLLCDLLPDALYDDMVSLNMSERLCDEIGLTDK